MLDRLDWAYQRRERYIGWAEQVAASPYSPLDRLEFALISAHTPFVASVTGFKATRGLRGVVELAEALYSAGVVASYNKAAYILSLRECLDIAPLPSLPFKEYRKHWKLPGLACCKLSFGCSLLSPLQSDVVCVDTHIAQVYGQNARRVWANLQLYEAVESILTAEAEECGLPPFPYQWAVWDWKRLQGGSGVVGSRVNSHDFLWRGGEKGGQLPLFSSLQ